MNQDNVRLTNYLMNQGEFPFKKRVKFLLYVGDLAEEIGTLLQGILNKVSTYYYQGVTIIFFEDDKTLDIQEIFRTISDDFAQSIYIHEGFTLNKNIPGSLITSYIECIKEASLLSKEYSNLTDLVFSSENMNIGNSFLKQLKQYLVDPLLNKNNNRTILDVYFKNDLNVLKTSKELYLNRNSLTNRLEIISRDLGLDVQSFKSAAVVLIIMNYKY